MLSVSRLYSLLCITFCIGSLEHDGNKYDRLSSMCNVVAEIMRYPHPCFFHFCKTLDERTNDVHVLEMTTKNNVS